MGHTVESIEQKKLELRELVIDQVKWFSLILGCLTFLDTLKIQFDEGKFLLVALYSLIFVAAMSMLFIKQIATPIRVYVLVAAIYAVGLLALLDEGIIGSGPLWLIAFPAVTAALVGKRKAVVAIIISFITGMLYLHFAEPPANFPKEIGLDYFTHGLDQSFDLLLLSFIASIPAAILFDKVNLQLEVEIKQSKQLSDAIHQLVQANNDLDAFAHTVSHDLRSPIRHIDSYVNLAKTAAREGDQETLATSMDRISESAHKASNLIDQILRLSRIGNMELNIQDVDLSSLVEKSFQILKADSRHQATETQVTQSCRIRGDLELIRIAIDNLASNAFKYSHTSEKPKVEFGCHRDGSETVYFIRDNGVGFDPERVARLFEPFTRLHSGPEFEGFGVGLATVKKIIDKHGGRIWAESAEGQGACFYFCF